jgi:hypothetical protein
MVTITSGTGTCSVTATKAADQNYLQASSAPATVSATLATQATLAVTGVPTTSQAYGAQFTVSSSGGSGTGAVTFSAQGACSVAGAMVTITSGTGTCSVTATKAADDDYGTATSAVESMALVKASVTDMLQASAAAVLLESSLNLSAKVSSLIGTPTGSVKFMDGPTMVGSGVLDGTGTAGLTISTLAAGNHDLTAIYSGDANFNSATSNAVAEVVQDFQLTLGGGSAAVTVQPGRAAVYSFQMAPTNGTSFPRAITLSLSGLPPGASYSITPSEIPAGSGVTGVTVEVQTARAISGLQRPPGGASRILFALSLAFPLLGWVGLRQTKQRHFRLVVVLGALLGLGIAGMSACGAGSGFLAQVPQTYNMTLTATAGALQHSSPLSPIPFT